MDIETAVSVFILTKDRQEYLKQNIAWHTKVGINYKLYVIDASKRPNGNWAKSGKNITYIHMPEANFFERARKVEAVLCTDYFVICPDDDFLLPGALKEILQYLTESSNENVSAAQGRYFLFDGDELYPKKIYKHSYSAFDGLKVQGSSILQRMLFANSYPIFHYCYSICRKEVIKNFNKITKKLDKNDPTGTIDHSLFEPLMGFAVAISGEYVAFNNAYSVRRPGGTHKITGAEDIFCGESYSEAQDIITRNLSKLDYLENNKVEYNAGYVRAILDSYCNAREKRLSFIIKKNVIDNSGAFASLLKLVIRRINEKTREFLNLFSVGQDYFDFNKEVYNIAKTDISELQNFLKKTQNETKTDKI